MTRAKATMEPCEIPPGALFNFELAKPPGFLGQRILNRGSQRGLVIAYVFVGANNQLLRTIPLSTMDCVAELLDLDVDKIVKKVRADIAAAAKEKADKKKARDIAREERR